MEAGKACLLALRAWTPDAVWQQSENIQGAAGEDIDEKDRVRAVLTLRDQMVTVLEDVTDPEEQENVIAIFYAQIRCHWILLNTQSGYQIADGKINRNNYLQSALLASLLDKVEAFLDPADVSRMTDFLTQPTKQPAAVTRATGSGSSDSHNPGVDLARLKRDADNARTERAILQTGLGFSDASAVLDHVQDMKRRLAALEDIQIMLGNLEDTVSLVNI